MAADATVKGTPIQKLLINLISAMIHRILTLKIIPKIKGKMARTASTMVSALGVFPTIKVTVNITDY